MLHILYISLYKMIERTCFVTKLLYENINNKLTCLYNLHENKKQISIDAKQTNL